MSLYKHVSTDEVREISDELISEWTVANNPKALVWATYTPPEPPPPPIPQEVTRRQFFLSVYSQLSLTREQLRASISDEAALIDFDEAQTFKRDYPLLLALAAQLGYTDPQIDQLFQYADSL